jgi:hypothetical protein
MAMLGRHVVPTSAVPYYKNDRSCAENNTNTAVGNRQRGAKHGAQRDNTRGRQQGA